MQEIGFTNGEWMALHQVLAGSVTQLFIHAWDHCYTVKAVSSSGVVVTYTLERILFLDFMLGLAVTEINIKKYRNKKIKTLKMQNDVGMACQKVQVNTICYACQ